MMGVISNLLNVIWKALKTLGEFLAVLFLGLVAAILLMMPWLLRALALIGWLAGTFMTWLTINNLYSANTPTLPLIALTAVPAILSAALVVVLLIHINIRWGMVIRARRFRQVSTQRVDEERQGVDAHLR